MQRTMSSSASALPRAPDSQNSVGSEETGAASAPPASPPGVVTLLGDGTVASGDSANLSLRSSSPKSSKVVPVPPRRRRLTRGDSTDSMLMSTDSVLSGPLARTVTNVEVLPEDQVRSMRAVFDMFDESGDGIIQPVEVGAMLRRLNLVTSRRLINVIIEITDIDGDGELQFEEFVTLMARVKEEAAQDDEAQSEDGGQDAHGVFVQMTPEEKLAKKTRQMAVSAFQRAVTMMAFTHLSSDDDKLFDELLKVLSTPPLERTEWELQRLLLWAENVKTGNPQNGFPFILGLPGQDESNVRIEVCRCMTLEKVEAGTTIMKQGDKGECMYIIMKGEVEVLAEENGKEKHLAIMRTGSSFGDIAIMADTEEEQVRTATIRSTEACILGVLSRDDYRRHILRMQQEAKAEVVEMMQNVPYLSRVSRGDLLRMAMMFQPMVFRRGDLIAQQGETPESVIFITSGTFAMTVGKHDPTTVMQVSVGSTIEPLGLQIISEEQPSYRCTLRAVTRCEGWSVGRNVAKRVLNKRHVLQAYQEHTDMMETLIQKRVTEAHAGDAVRSSLGFTPRKVRSMVEKAVVSRRVPRSADASHLSAPTNKDYRRGSVYVPEAKDQKEDEQRKLMAMANYARHHPHRQPLHVAKAPRSLPGPMLRDTTTVAFGKSIRKPGIASHEDQELLWHLPDDDGPVHGSTTSMAQPSEATVAATARSVSTTARLASAASATTAVAQATPEAAAVAAGTPRGSLGPNRDEADESEKRRPAVKPMPPPRLLGGAARSRGQVILGGVGIGARGLSQGAPVPKAVPPTTPTSAQRLSQRAHFQGRPVSLSRAGHGFEMKDPVPVILDSGAGARASGGGGLVDGGASEGRIGALRQSSARRSVNRMGVSARGPHSVRAHSRASTAVTSSAG